MKLYFSPTSPYVRKVSVTASELGVPLEIETVLIHDPRSDFGRINPVHRIPALRLDDGSVMFDSRVICEYLTVLKDNRLLPASGAARWHVLKLQVLGDGLLDAAVPRRGEVLRPPSQQSPERLAEYERSIRLTIDYLNAHAADLAGLSIGTIAIGCGLGYLDFRFPQDNWRTGRPHIAAWYDAFAKRPSMTASAPKG